MIPASVAEHDECEHCGKPLVDDDWHIDNEGITLCTEYYRH